MADETSGQPLAAGPVRLFPLPNVVLFPHAVQPLHIFEPRYCDMLEEAVATDRLIALVLLEPGWEQAYEGRPPIAPVACLGKVIAHERLPAGRHNILLRGLRRAAIRRELPPSRPFRLAEADLLEDFYPSSGMARRARMQRQLVELSRKLLPDAGALHEQLDEMLAGQAALGMLADIFSYTLGFPLPLKQRLLAEWNVDRRAKLLIDKLSALATRAVPLPTAAGDAFPPPFSLN